MWALPETAGSPAGYKIYTTDDGQLHRIYGGDTDQTSYFDSHTVIDTGLLYKNFQLNRKVDTLVYVVNGDAIINGRGVKDGDLIRATDIDLKVVSDNVHLTVIGLGEQ